MTKRTPIRYALAKVLRKLNVNILLGGVGLVLAILAFAFDLFGFRVDRQDNETTSEDLATLIEDIRVNARPRIVGLVNTYNPYAIPVPGNGEIALRTPDEDTCTASWIDKDTYVSIGISNFDEIETAADLFSVGDFTIEIAIPPFAHFAYDGDDVDDDGLPLFFPSSSERFPFKNIHHLTFSEETKLFEDQEFREMIYNFHKVDFTDILIPDRCRFTPFETFSLCWTIEEGAIFSYADLDSTIANWPETFSHFYRDWIYFTEVEWERGKNTQYSQRPFKDLLEIASLMLDKRSETLLQKKRSRDEEIRQSIKMAQRQNSDKIVVTTFRDSPEPFIPQPWIPASPEDRFTLNLSQANMVRALESLPLCLEIKGKRETFLVRMSDRAIQQGLGQKDYEDMKKAFKAPSLLRNDGTFPDFILDEKVLRFYYVDHETGQQRWLNGDKRR